MRQYTSYEQTVKLIELGLSDSIRYDRYKSGKLPANYSIGELIEMMADCSTIWDYTPYVGAGRIWRVQNVHCPPSVTVENAELVDALFEMVVQLNTR